MYGRIVNEITEFLAELFGPLLARCCRLGGRRKSSANWGTPAVMPT